MHTLTFARFTWCHAVAGGRRRIELNVAKLEINGELLEMQVLDTTSNPTLWERGAFSEFFDAVEAVVLVCDAHDSASIAGSVQAPSRVRGLAQPLTPHRRWFRSRPMSIALAKWAPLLARHPAVQYFVIGTKVDMLPSEVRPADALRDTHSASCLYPLPWLRVLCGGRCVGRVKGMPAPPGGASGGRHGRRLL